MSGDFFRLFGAALAEGRPFTDAEQQPSGSSAVIVSHDFWRQHLNGDRHALGQTLTLGEQSYVIVGVLSAGFEGKALAGPVFGEPDVWLPLRIDPHSRNQTNTLVAVARLTDPTRSGVASGFMAAVTERFRSAFPSVIGPQDLFAVQSLKEAMFGDFRPSLLVLQGAVGLIFLFACVNVTGLLTVRTTVRSGELALRVAVGTSRSRVLTLVTAEAAAIATLNGLIGFLAARLGFRLFLQEVPLDSLSWLLRGDVSRPPYPAELGFAVALTFAAFAVIALMPALTADGARFADAIREGGNRVSVTRRQRLIRSAIIAAQTSVTLVLLLGAALLGRTFLALSAVHLGFQPQNVLTMRMTVGDAASTTGASVTRLVDEGDRALGSVPGVEIASASCCVPLEGNLLLRFNIVGRPLTGSYHGMANWRSVSPEYFDTLGIALRSGRLFSQRDRLGSPAVVVINEVMARQFWPNADPLAERIAIGRGLGPNFADEPERRIVGIVNDVRDVNLYSAPRMTIYVPILQLPDGVMRQTVGGSLIAWMIRTRVDSQPMRQSLAGSLEKAGNGQSVSMIRSLSEITRSGRTETDLYLILFSSLAGLALVLVLVGIGGSALYAVEQRAHEICVRMALGADPMRLRRSISLEAMRTTFIAVLIGIVCSAGLGRFLASVLFGVSPHDVLIFTTIPAFVLVISASTVWLATSRVEAVDLAQRLRVR